MSSGDVTVPDGDDRLYVGYSARDEMWWAVGGKEGSFGGSKIRREAIAIARDASATAYHGKRHIVVRTKAGKTEFVIRLVNQKASPQFFQDSVE